MNPLTINEAIELLIAKQADVVELRKPPGVLFIDILSDAIEFAQGTRLDKLAAEYFNMYRLSVDLFTEPDTVFRNRIRTSRKIPETSHSSCNHTWTNYYGLAESYEYCTKCNKKKVS